MLTKQVILSICIVAPLYASVQTVIFAAGKSTRLASKLLKDINGKPVLYYPTAAVCELQQKDPIILVVGHMRDMIRTTIRNLFPEGQFIFADQEEQLGTGHALQCTQGLWSADHVLVINGDHPLTTANTLRNLIASHEASNTDVSILITKPTKPCSWGRIVQEGSNIRIVEAVDFKENVQDHPFVNAGYYIFRRTFLQQHINKLQLHENKGEYYVTDLIEIANNNHMNINCVQAPFDHVFGINTQEEFNYAQQLLQEKA